MEAQTIGSAKSLRLVIVGGVAGGASAAARARRLDEHAEIIVLEAGPYVSFANCGLPYHLGGVIEDRDDLLVQTPESLKERFNLDVRVRHEVTAIDAAAKKVTVKNHASGATEAITYDKLILAPGAAPFRPPINGLDLPNVFNLWTIPDLDNVLQYIKAKSPRHATVIGGGFIGIEVAENLRHKGLAVTVVEREKQVMPPIDSEMAELLHQHLRLHGVDLKLGASVTGIVGTGARTAVQLGSEPPLETDLVIVAIGARPRTELAKGAGLKIGERGGIVVDDRMQTSNPDIYAVGDAIEVKDRVTGLQTLIPLAGPANRQGRIAADQVFGRDSRYRGSQGTAICKIFDLAVAMTGASEKTLKRLKMPYQKAMIHAASHAGYYPGAMPLTVKIVFTPDTGKVLGAQAIGADGADKRVDVLATAIAAGMTVYDLEHLELCYAPPFGSAKDPVNVVGMVGANLLRGDHRGFQTDDLATMALDKAMLLDVRTPTEHEAGHIPGSVLIPVDELRPRMAELPRDREILIYCQQGLRGYVAQRQLVQKGFIVRNLVGGYKAWAMANQRLSGLGAVPVPHTQTFCSSPSTSPSVPDTAFELDACGLQCPGPLLKMRERLDELKEGQRLRIIATDPGFPADVAAWAKRAGHRLVSMNPEKGRYIALVERGPVAPPVDTNAALAGLAGKKRLTMVVFSNDLDKAMAAMIIANGAAAMGLEVTLFFTFWGLNILRKEQPPAVEKGLIDKMFGAMMPRGPEKLSLSKMNMGGMGTMMMKQVMAQKNVASLPELIASARKNKVRFVACTMSMDVMGLKKDELVDGVEEGGVAAYLDSASDSTINLFI